MSRRSDHTRAELKELIIREGHRQLSTVGFAHFSAREVAKRIGYSVGTLYNVFGSYDVLMLAINSRTLDLWQAELEARLAQTSTERLELAIEVYFDFATSHRHAWTALYDFRLPENVPMPEFYSDKIASVMNLVVDEITALLPESRRDDGPALARSILATVHGHCFFAINGSFRLLGETDPLGATVARVRETIAAAQVER